MSIFKSQQTLVSPRPIAQRRDFRGFGVYYRYDFSDRDAYISTVSHILTKTEVVKVSNTVLKTAEAGILSERLDELYFMAIKINAPYRKKSKTAQNMTTRAMHPKCRLRQ